MPASTTPPKEILATADHCPPPTINLLLASFFFQADDGIRDRNVTGVQTCALPICASKNSSSIRLRNGSVCSSKLAKKPKRSTRNFCSRSSTACHRPAALAWAWIGSPCCSPVRSRSATSSCFHCSDQRNKLGLVFHRTPVSGKMDNIWYRTQSARSTRHTNLSFHLKGHFGIDPVSSDLLVFHCGSEFFDVDRADVAQRFGSFAHDSLRGVFPTLRRFGQQFDDFNDFGHN